MRKFALLAGLILCTSGLFAQNGGNQYCTSPVSFGGGFTANKCQLGFNFSASTVSVTFSPTAGHPVLLGFYACGNASCNGTPQGTIAIADNINSPETCFISSPGSPNPPSSTNPNGKTRWYWQYCPSIPLGVTGFSFANTNGAFGGAIWAGDLTGGATSSPFDADGFSSSVAAGTSGSVSVTSTNAKDLICAMLDRDGGSASDTITAGFTALMDDGTGPGGVGGTGVLQCKFVNSAGTNTPTASWSAAGAQTWEGYAVAIKAAPAVQATPPLFVIQAQIAPTTGGVNVSWTPPAGCADGSCSFAVWRAPQGATAFTQLTAGVAAPPFPDNPGPGDWQYTVQAIQGGNVSAPSAVGTISLS